VDSVRCVFVGTGRASATCRNDPCVPIFYPSGGHRVEGFLVEPIAGQEHLPCLVFNRGGSNDFGKIEDEHLWMRNIGRFAEAGYLVIASQYSGCGQSEGRDDFCGEDTINDVACLYDLLARDDRADETRIGMYGASRGGMMTYLLLRRVSWVKTAVTLGGSAELRDTTFRPKMKEHYEKMFGGALEECEKRSVLAWAHELPKHVPLLLMHGTADWRVDPMDSIRLATRCYEERIPCRLVLYEGADHSASERWKHAYAEARSWFDRFVRDGEPLPNLEPHGP
jgi:dipeptidyl aminopeptidase/acylaminoacyl peptidase